MTGPVTTEALVEALAYLKPHETNGGTISLKAPKAREAVAVIEAALQQVTAERDEARAELARLRAEGEAKDRALKVALEAYDAAVRENANAEAVRQDVLGRQGDHPDIGEIMDQVGAEEGCMRTMAARGIARADLVAAVRTALARAATAREGA